MISRLEGDAVGHVQPYVAKNLSCVDLESCKSIINVLKLAYADVDPKGTACRAVIALYQTNKRFEHFWAEFHKLAQKAGIDSATTLEYLKDCFSNEIKDRLVNIDNTNIDLATFVKVVQGISTKLEILGKNRTNANSNTNRSTTINAKPTYQQAVRFAPVTPPTTITTNTSLPSTATSTHTGPMDVSFAGKQEPLTAEEKEQRNKLGLCRYCGQPGHIAKDHNDASTLHAKPCAAGLMATGLTAGRSKLDALGKALSSSIVALKDQ